ncbi:Cytochrome P450 CYP2 subfamily [Handroanthus impetiginosus]|uniref:Flavonoid-6-hydroxylase n=1 Tax=Handroanthus impetiginosus TaxID=429701 RepID=A0A2G9GC05_9LAMI|nr:Cytochrome P450 CYP2 subfamily [Handroanthus impetiginosus]
MDLFQWFIVLFTLSVTLYTLVKVNRNIPKKKSPPETAGGWPLIGHLRLLSGPELPHITLSKMAEKYGPVFTIRLGVYRALIVNNAETAKECFTNNGIIFSHRPNTAAVQHMSYNYAMFGFSKYGSYWRELRKISMLKLLSNQKVSVLGNLRENEVKSMMKTLHKSSWEKEGSSVEMKKVLGNFTLNFILRIVVGEIEDYKDSGTLREAITEFFRMMGVLTVPDVLPFLRWLEYFGTNKKFEKTGRKLDSMLQGLLDYQRDQCKKRCGFVEEEEGFMAQMMDCAEGIAKEFPMYDADTINKATCQAVILGGTDTMTVTLTWALSLLLNNPDALKKAQEELDLHIGPQREVKESDLENLVYIKAIIKETLRLYPAASLLPSRKAVEDCTVAGYHVPAGTHLIVNAWKLHRDPRFWSDPLEFQPERFLTKYKEIDVRGRNFELLPFGGARRICPGISFALQTMELVLASFLHGFEVKTPAEEDVDMTGSMGATNVKVTPLEVLLKPRLVAELYA